MTSKQKKAVALVKNCPQEKQTLEMYDSFMTLQESTLDMCMNDLGLSIEPIVAQLDFTMELELLTTKQHRSE